MMEDQKQAQDQELKDAFIDAKIEFTRRVEGRHPALNHAQFTEDQTRHHPVIIHS